MIAWTYAFIDRPRAQFDVAVDFWTTVTGSRLSPRRGDDGEFATFVPPGGSAHLKIQGVGGTGGSHIDLVTTDVPELVERAVGCGAEIPFPHATWYGLRSPGGQPFCIGPHAGEEVRAGVVTSPDGVTSRVDQIAIDVAPAAYETEAEFWATITGWPSHQGSRPEFHLVQNPDHLPVRILVQRLDQPRETSAHIDIACADVAAIRAWHERLGATFVAEHPHWTVMRDPAGGVYCLTARNPETGRFG